MIPHLVVFAVMNIQGNKTNYKTEVKHIFRKQVHKGFLDHV